MDTSSSVTEGNFHHLLGFVTSLVAGLDVDGGQVRVGLVTFSSHPTVQFNLKDFASTSKKLEKAILKIPYIAGSGTNTMDALRAVRTKLFLTESGNRPHAQNIEVLIMDGVSNIAPNSTIPEAQISHKLGIHIITIGIGMMGNTREADAIASVPSNINRYLVRDYADLSSTREKLLEHICRGTQILFAFDFIEWTPSDVAYIGIFLE